MSAVVCIKACLAGAVLVRKEWRYSGRGIEVPNDGHARRVSDQGVGFAPSERTSGNSGKVSLPQRNPMRSVVGEPDIAGDLKHDQAKCEYIGGLVVLALKNLWGDVPPISFTFDASSCWPSRRQAKVPNLESAFVIDQNVCRFEIEVNEASFVDALQALFIPLEACMTKN